MEQKYLLDSNVVIGYLGNKLPLAGMRYISAIVNAVPNISAITKIEVLRFNTTPDSYRILQEFIATSVVYPISEKIVDMTINLCRQTKIKIPDAIIAATCLAEQMILLTRNIVDFKRLPDLRIENPWVAQ
ncbi:putative toxin VapC [Candidatus Termititenax persephonae]|uniref:Toxin VapC n=1 Tax=Candidatus Termititenax persephonae TaxID=2218525 RepID=A0A388TKD5_9BACT|nr:putative toxin VapC [Candidatus Termititenax persephonae]